MIITRFQGEMLASFALRARRGNFNVSNGEPLSYFSFDRAGTRSFRLPLNFFPIESKDNVKVVETFKDATAWPLMLLNTQLTMHNVWSNTETWSTLERFNLWDVNFETKLQFCPGCVLEQRRDFGISWWQRNLNLPLVCVCPTHCIPLYFSSREMVTARGGLLPHELLNESASLPAEVNDKALGAAINVIDLCQRGTLISSDVLRKSLSEHYKHRISDAELHTQLGLPAQVMHPGRADFWRQHDGLTKHGDEDRFLAWLVLDLIKEKVSINKLVSLSSAVDFDTSQQHSFRQP